MAKQKVPERVRWAMDVLGAVPRARVLEMGCGPGVALGLVCERLTTGHVTGIDRSAGALARARVRNAAHLAAGKADLWRGELEDFTPDAGAFDVVFAINVNVFWTGPARAGLRRLAELTRPGGVVHLLYEAPNPARATRIVEGVRAKLAEEPFTPTLVRGPSANQMGLTAVHRARGR